MTDDIERAIERCQYIEREARGRLNGVNVHVIATCEPVPNYGEPRLSAAADTGGGRGETLTTFDTTDELDEAFDQLVTEHNLIEL